jgi:bifunctional non-homologous end joining protein LigD
MRSLDEYAGLRDFASTPEPAPDYGVAGVAPRFAIQKHAATRLHYDLRLEHAGVLLSWAVTRGPSLNPKEKRLSVRTEDHPTDYLTFEGVIAKGNYGAGVMMLWDWGWWQPFHDVDEGLASGHLHFALLGQRSTGKWSLVRMNGKLKQDAGRENWLLIKEADEAARGAGSAELIDLYATSLASGRTMAQIADDAPNRSLSRKRKTAAPDFHPPQLAELHEAPPEGEVWWHEVKLDGYRAQIALGKHGPRIFTRNGQDWTGKFPPLLPSLDALPARTALIDGEILAGAGLERFGDVALAIDHGGPFLFYAFDILHLDGADLTGKPLGWRRAALEKLFASVTPRGVLRLSPILEGDAGELFSQIAEAGGEGLVSKLRAAPYRSGRSGAWVKSKAERRGAFAIVGYQHSAARGRGFASLLLAAQDGGRLVYRGKVGTGFDAASEAELLQRLAPLKHNEPILADPPRLRAKVTWVQPSLIAEVRYAEITRDNHLRQASFIALREDKILTELVTDDPATRTKVAGVGISHPDRLVYPKPKVTKLMVAEYYEAAAERLLSFASKRPLSLLRLPSGLEGQEFFQKHRGKGFPAAMRQIDLPDAKGEMQDKMYLSTPASLLAAVQMGTLEFHIEGVRIDKPQMPDRMIFDLDPDEGLGFTAVRKAALLLRDVLAEGGLESWPMLTGGKGIHVVVPLQRVASIESVNLFSRVAANLLADRLPKMFTAKLSKRERKGRIFIDWMRNEPGATAVAPYSLRARPGAPVAMPVVWDDLSALRKASAFNIKNALAFTYSGTTQIRPARISEDAIGTISSAISHL